VGGLEIEDPESHQFIPVRASKPAVLVNLGDAMERWSNGLLPAAYHRVSKPDQSDKPHQAGTVTNGDHVIPARYSIVYFGKPDRGASLAPLERFVTSTRPARYPSVTGAELNQGTLLRTYEDEGVVQDTKDTTGTSDGDHVQILRS
jgi:isopenicillin N synthase-like dioxygenase